MNAFYFPCTVVDTKIKFQIISESFVPCKSFTHFKGIFCTFLKLGFIHCTKCNTCMYFMENETSNVFCFQLHIYLIESRDEGKNGQVHLMIFFSNVNKKIKVFFWKVTPNLDRKKCLIQIFIFQKSFQKTQIKLDFKRNSKETTEEFA